MNLSSTAFHLFLIIVVLIFWKLSFFPSNSLVGNHKTALLWLAFMSGCALLLYFVLEKWSAPSVRGDFDEVSFYLVFSLLWIVLIQSAFAFFGISIRALALLGLRRGSAGGFGTWPYSSSGG